MLLVLGSYAPSLSNFCSRSAADILRARQAMAACMFACGERGRALAEARFDLHAMGLR
jgi:hypothetical protein